MSPTDLDKLLEKYLAGKCSEEERSLIDAWYSRLGKDNADQPVAEHQLTSAEAKILSGIGHHSHANNSCVVGLRKGRRIVLYFSGIAASVLICVAAGWYFLNRQAPEDLAHRAVAAGEFIAVENQTNIAQRLILPDGSIVMTSPGSHIRYSTSTVSPSREVFLEGEGYFDVAHNTQRPFYVYAGNVVTRVLGTSFVVRNPGGAGKVTVSVKTGKVTVYSRKTSHKQTVLAPNQEAIYDSLSDLVATQRVPAASQAARPGNPIEMHFEETPVSDVLALLMKTYDIDIVFQADTLSGCVLTSSFFEEGLYDRIDVICTAIGATYKIVDTQIIIESKGCNLKTN